MADGSLFIVKDDAIVGRVLSSDGIGKSLQERRLCPFFRYLLQNLSLVTRSDIFSLLFLCMRG
ncbi:hypothetical protein GIB67_008115 [Kingdonia uniflora]|uniref:Uncharacterized protein n=1 Tax=Kingdonia uniflora TaxID=39325 RepID=A0A7J7MSW8_9MAGN|nr:hypothetical protein GIB67_008115 [Kingdonia uniflora]